MMSEKPAPSRLFRWAYFGLAALITVYEVSVCWSSGILWVQLIGLGFGAAMAYVFYLLIQVEITLARGR